MCDRACCYTLAFCVGNCETCFHKNQCDTANNYYCCPYMRKCIQSGGSCTSPTARCNPRCSDSTCDLEQGCASCTGCQYVGAGQQYSWLEWANLGDSGGSMSKYSPTCSSSGSAAATTHTPATTKELAAITVTHTTATSSSTSASTATVTPCKDGALFEFDNFEIGLLGENTLKYINSVSDMGGPITELGCAKRCIHWEGTQKAVDGSYTAVECVAFNWQTEEKACILKSSRGGALNAEGYREKFRFYNKLIGTSCRRSTSTTTSTQITTTTTTPDTTAITATSSTITTTTLMVDCEFSFSTCSPSCEKGVDRVISISRHATGAGAPCPVQNDFPDCHPGDGLCPTSTTTLSTTTTATSTTATLATTATVKTKVTTTEHTSEGGGPIAVVKCPGGVLEGYGPARNNKKGRFLKGSGIIRYVHISATLDTCAQECYVDAVCRGFSIRTEGDAVCQLHNTAGVTGMLQSDQAGWLFYLKGSGCTSHMSTADPATTLAPGSSVISSSQTVGQSGTSIAVTKVVTPATLPSTISQTGSTDAVTGVPVGSATIAEEASTLIFVSRAPLISTTVAEAEVRSQNDAASNEFNPTLVSCWLALDCATLDIAVVINDVYLGLAGCGVPRTLIKTITVKCGSTQILISTTSAQAANGVRARIKAQELVIRTHGQDLNATLDTSTPPFAADGNKVGVLPTALEDENPKTTPGVSNKTNATTVESTAADNMESSDAKDNVSTS